MSHRFLFFQHRLSRPVSSITMEDFFLIIRSFCHLSVIPSKSSKIKKNFDGVRYIIITLNAILLLFLRRLFGFLKKESSKIGQFFDRIQRWEYLKFFVFTSDKWRSYLASSFLSASLIVFSRKKNFEITRIIFDLNWIEWIVNWFELIEEISKYFQKTDPADWKLIALAPQLYKYWCSQLTHHTHFVLNSE